MSDDFEAVVAAVLDHADGRRHLKVLSAAEAEALARGLHRRADRMGDERQAVADEEGLTVACARGCSACCRVPVVVYEPEAIAVARWLRRPGNAGARRGFEERYRGWRAALGERVDALIALHRSGDIEAAEAAYSEISDRGVMCAFLHNGACSIYPVRPNACRYFIALETSEHCEIGSEQGPAILDHEPYDRLMEKARYLLRAAASIGPGGGAPSTLCDRVAELLAEKAEVGRNDPCPCGSGKKHKRCCGR